MMTPGAMIEADLHGLVDGQIDPARRTGALRCLAASPAERARVEAWQMQGDLLRSAFAGVDREPLPAMLDLRARPQLHCVPANDAPLVAPVRERPRRRRLAVVAAFAVMAGGFAGGWALLNGSDTGASHAASTPYKLVDAEVVRDPAPGPAPSARTELPTRQIPDLRMAGFRFTGAEMDALQPATILFRYRNDNGERLLLSVSRAATPPTRVGRAASWQSGGKLFALAGTPTIARLRTIAAGLQQASR